MSVLLGGEGGMPFICTITKKPPCEKSQGGGKVNECRVSLG